VPPLALLLLAGFSFATSNDPYSWGRSYRISEDPSVWSLQYRRQGAGSSSGEPQVAHTLHGDGRLLTVATDPVRRHSEEWVTQLTRLQVRRLFRTLVKAGAADCNDVCWSLQHHHVRSARADRSNAPTVILGVCFERYRSGAQLHAPFLCLSFRYRTSDPQQVQNDVHLRHSFPELWGVARADALLQQYAESGRPSSFAE